MELWNGYRIEKTDFEGRELICVYPKEPNGKWAIKSEYFEASQSSFACVTAKNAVSFGGDQFMESPFSLASASIN